MNRFFCGATLVSVLFEYAMAEPCAFLQNGVTAHRGNAGEFPENTLSAFESALALGADWIETDICLTQDRQVVIGHDKDTARVGDKNLNIAQSTYAELLTVDVATDFRKRNHLTMKQCPPLRMPLLVDALKLIMRQNRTRLSLQPKDECVKAAFEIVRGLGAEKWVGFNDGSLAKMRQVKSLDRDVPVFWDRDAHSDLADDIRVAREEGFECLVVNGKGLSKEKVDAIRQAGLVAGVWTVNSEEEMRHFLSVGTQRIYTDYPARLLRLKKKAAEPRFISHRGESADFPENTMSSFRAAAERGADGCECDIYLTKDNEIICMHDGTAKRTAGRDVKPSDATLAEMRALDAGSWKGPQFAGERIPTLAELLSLARDGFEIYVEVKCGTEILPKLVEVMAAEPRATPERVLFICFKTNVVTALREKFPAYRSYWLTGTKLNDKGQPVPTAAEAVATATACNASGIDAQASAALSAAYVREVKAAGLSFHAWTVDDARKAAGLMAMGVDTITSDCGADLAAVLRNKPDERPLVHWAFDGTAANSGTGGRTFDAALAGMPAYTEGAAGRALVLDGTNGVASVALPLLQHGTIALWYRPTAFYNFNTVFDNVRNPDQWEMWIGDSGVMRFRMGRATGEVSCDLKPLGGPGRWYHIAVVWDNVSTNQARLYVDGVRRACGAIGRWIAPGKQISFGGGNSGNTKGRGALDDVRVYGVPLPDSQVRALYEARGTVSAAVVDEDFEGKLPDLHTCQATFAADSSCAHGGSRSLRVTPAKDSGGAYFKLDGKLDFSCGYEYSAWVKADADGAANLYISASDGAARYTVSGTHGGVAGKWVRLHGVVHAKQWRPRDREFMLALSTRGESRFDDATLRKADVPDPAIEVWPCLEANLHAAADRRAVILRRGGQLVLDAAQAVLAPAIDRTGVVSVAESAVAVPADGLLTFAVDAEVPLVVTGELELEPDADLRPGLRAYVLSDDTLVGAPMVKAAPWHNAGKREIDPAPTIQGEKPAVGVKLIEWRLDKGRHYLTVAGPHMRSAGRFRRLTLRALTRSASEPLYTFAVFADTHLGEGRPEWVNVKMDGPAIAELGESFNRLRKEGVAFALIAGDMTDGGRPSQVEALKGAIQAGGLPVYGCIGNHEVFTAGSRTNLTALIPGLFPSGKTQYALDKPPLRFIVLDGTWWRDHDGHALEAYDKNKAVRVAPQAEEIDWLRQALAADTRTPTLVMWHYPFYSERGVTSCGYRLGDPMVWSPDVMELLHAAPNVAATLNGHMHYNAADTDRGIVCLQNAAFVEWPNLYRVLRVYADRIEWEVRQVHNRGFVSEGMLPEKALTWMISIREGDLGGTIELASKKR